MQDKIYLDYAATTPCDNRVIDAMIPYFSENFGNPNSLHLYGEKAKGGENRARQQIANLINADFDEVIFTSGATESSNIAILRAMEHIKDRFFATIKTEHKATLTCAETLRRGGVAVKYLDINSDGLLNFEALETLLENVGLLSICLVNNETGALQDIKRISEMCTKNDVLLHIDATQGFGKIPIDVKFLDIDFLSASAHKIYGPKGIGILFCKKTKRKYIRIPNANYDVEFGIRAGTIPVPLCVGFGAAANIAQESMESDYNRIKNLRMYLIDSIKAQLEEIYINGSGSSNYPGIINLSFRGCEGEALMMEANRIAISSGSACTSNKLSISHVLAAMNIRPDIAQSSLRISIGRMTTKEDIDVAIEALINATNKLRKMSPIWDMIKSGIDIDSVFKR
ncbi:MAG: cysteine desulfurase [Alphaproteobacteria bacterium]|nr:cysteine desulfurase [Alphaproteobacteria bacterium]